MKILITGSHFTPAIAVIEELREYEGVEIIYVGRKFTQEGDNAISQESIIIPQMGVTFIPIVSGRFRRDLSFYSLISLLKIPIGFLQSIKLILGQKPDVILSFGGYIAVPVVLTGWLFSIPIITHSQTLVPGLANIIASFFADKKAISFSKNRKVNDILTGLPIRKQFFEPSNKIKDKYLRFFRYAKENNLIVILIACGNQGSHKININVEYLLEELLKIACVIHVTGNSRYKDYERLKKIENERYCVEKWIDDDFSALLSKCNIVISRAGINSLCELAILGKPALVIPLDKLTYDEQNENAKFFKQFGLIQVLSQKNLRPNSLLWNIKSMIKNLPALERRAKGAYKIIIPDAAKKLALETFSLVKRV